MLMYSLTGQSERFSCFFIALDHKVPDDMNILHHGNDLIFPWIMMAGGKHHYHPASE